MRNGFSCLLKLQIRSVQNNRLLLSGVQNRATLDRQIIFNDWTSSESGCTADLTKHRTERWCCTQSKLIRWCWPFKASDVSQLELYGLALLRDKSHDHPKQSFSTSSQHISPSCKHAHGQCHRLFHKCQMFWNSSHPRSGSERFYINLGYINIRL